MRLPRAVTPAKAAGGLTGLAVLDVLLESVSGDAARHADAFEDYLCKMIETGVVRDAALAVPEADALAFWAIRDAPADIGSSFRIMRPIQLGAKFRGNPVFARPSENGIFPKLRKKTPTSA